MHASFARLQTRSKYRDRVAGRELDDRLLPTSCLTRRIAPALRLGLYRGGAYVGHLDIEELLDRLPDLRLVGPLVHSEGVLPGFGKHVGLLRDDRPDDHLSRLHQSALRSASRYGAEARATNAGRAACETSSEAAQTRSTTPASSTGIASTRGML